MGRAIVREPKVFLFDEPLSNLDAKLRVQMRTEIKKLRERVRTTGIYVTHDQVEAMTLADRIVLMNSGRVEQIGTPEDVYEAPATLFVAGFIGASAMNFIPGRVENGGSARAVVLANGARLEMPPDRFDAHDAMPVTVGLRPEHLHWADEEPAPSQGPRASWSRSAPIRWSCSISPAASCRRDCRRARCAAPVTPSG